MYFLIIPIMFVSVVPIMYEPLNLARSIIFIWWVLIGYIFLNVQIKLKHRLISKTIIITLFAVVIGYVISAFWNGQIVKLALFGHHNRNMGILFLASIALLVQTLVAAQIKATNFIKFALNPLYFLIVTYGIIQISGLDPLIWFENDRTTLTLGNSDFAAALIASIVALPIYTAIQTNNIYMKTILMISLCISVYIGLYSQAFQFRVIAIISVLTYLGVYFRDSIFRSSRRSLAVISGSVIISSVVVFMNWTKWELVSRTNALDRWQSTVTGLKVFQDHLFFGVGIEQFWKFEPKYKGVEQAIRNGSNSVPDKVHNVFVDHLANGGMLVALPFFVMVIASCILVYRLSNMNLKKQDRNFVALLCSIWISYVSLLFITTDNVFAMALAYSALGILIRMYDFNGKQVKL